MSALATGCPGRPAPVGVSPAADQPAQEAGAFVTSAKGRLALDLVVQGARCGGCLSKIETAVGALPGIKLARLNLSTGRMRVEWTGALPAKDIIQVIARLGYEAAAVDPSTADDPHAAQERRLLTAMAVAGFAAGNVMLLSVSVWAGRDMAEETRTLLHWISALIAIPAALFAGQPFFASALASIRARRLNMDVPISLAVILALGLSLHASATRGEHAYFDASVMLLFFLLIGRFLDARLRRRAYAAANALAARRTASAVRIRADGGAEAVRAADLRPGDIILAAAGESLAVDAELVSGESEVDLRMVTGEVEPARTFAGQVLHAGTVNLASPLRLRAIAPASQSLTAEIARLLEAGEQKKSSYRKLADKAAEAYVPRVHAMAALGFAGWMIAGASLQHSVFIAVAVLIITCPCAMALAAPLVQVVAAGRLFRERAYLASGDALERIATVDHVVLDKTGTLTLGDPVLVPGCAGPRDIERAALLARASRHPFSRAIAAAAGPGPLAAEIEEHPGQGVTGIIDGRAARLGSAAFVGAADRRGSAIWFAFDGEAPVAFLFEDRLRPDAAEAVARLRHLGCEVELLSGDGPERVALAARAAGVERWTAEATPQSKAAHLETLERSGRKVLMVGDGLNDAGALAKAHASLAPGGAVDVSRLAADCVFAGESLRSVVRIVEIARAARARMRENFGFATVYNILATPIALAGWATPLVAAIAMSASSLVVTLNALRLAGGRDGREP
jgi:P-type Cu2+ transporter